MSATLQSGWFAHARRVPSPNCDARPADGGISLIVIHGISLPPGEYGGPWIDALFTNRLDPDAHPYFKQVHDRRVSSHLLIRRDGEVVQYVPLHLRAWHAGASCFDGRNACNDFSIGIELEGSDDEAYTDIQYQQLADTIRQLRNAFPAITARNIVGHADVSPGRKTDPGPSFDWQRLHDLLA